MELVHLDERKKCLNVSKVWAKAAELWGLVEQGQVMALELAVVAEIERGRDSGAGRLLTCLKQSWKEGYCYFSENKHGVFFLNTKLDFTQLSRKSEWLAMYSRPEGG